MKRYINLMTLLILSSVWLTGCPKKQTLKTEEPLEKVPQVAQPAAPPAEPKAEAPKIEFKTVYFDFDSYDIRQDAKPILSEAAQLMRRYPQISLRLEGHCDERGTAEYNLALGEKRANAVRDYLVSLGVERARLSTVSFGKERPAALGHDEESWAKNRRVELKPEGK